MDDAQLEAEMNFFRIKIKEIRSGRAGPNFRVCSILVKQSFSRRKAIARLNIGVDAYCKLLKARLFMEYHCTPAKKGGDNFLIGPRKFSSSSSTQPQLQATLQASQGTPNEAIVQKCLPEIMEASFTPVTVKRARFIKYDNENGNQKKASREIILTSENDHLDLRNYFKRTMASEASADRSTSTVLCDRFFAKQNLFEFALLGCLNGSSAKEQTISSASLSSSPTSGVTSSVMSSSSLPVDVEIFLNTHEPFCFVAVGVQGGGKSHTMGCVLEACLVPYCEANIVQLDNPMSALVLHYDQNVNTECEAAGLVWPSRSLPASCPRRCFPIEGTTILVSPSFYKQRKSTYEEHYGSQINVRPLQFRWENLSADHIKRIMRVKDDDQQPLYISVILDILRKHQRNDALPSFETFKTQIRTSFPSAQQSGPLKQRIQLLDALIADSAFNKDFEDIGADLESVCSPNSLVIVDLSDKLLAKDEANSIFEVLVEQYRALPLQGGKLLVLDEAHKFMSGDSSDGLSEAIVDVARLMRHDGIRLAVSTQNPKALAPELLELVTVSVMHQFHSKDWFTYLSQKVPVAPEAWDKILALDPGMALVYATKYHGDQAKGRFPYGHNVFEMRIRQRITADRGASHGNVASAAAHEEEHPRETCDQLELHLEVTVDHACNGSEEEVVQTASGPAGTANHDAKASEDEIAKTTSNLDRDVYSGGKAADDEFAQTSSSLDGDVYNDGKASECETARTSSSPIGNVHNDSKATEDEVAKTASNPDPFGDDDGRGSEDEVMRIISSAVEPSFSN